MATDCGGVEGKVEKRRRRREREREKLLSAAYYI